MLRHTFQHLPGIGPRTERRLWFSGFLSWQDCNDGNHHSPISRSMLKRLGQELEESVQALNDDHAHYFETRLPSAEVWRLYSDFGDRVAFLDIETTGLYCDADAITVIGLFDGTQAKTFVKGINLFDFYTEIRNYSLVVTFNGKRFDMPFIREAFGQLPDRQAHLDLLYPLRNLGYHGGLKSIESQLGVHREGTLRDVNGFMAVLLWREYRRGNRNALNTLLRYNLEDVVNLQFLADVVYNESVSRLPIDIPALPVHPKYDVDIPFDPELIDYLASLMR